MNKPINRIEREDVQYFKDISFEYDVMDTYQRIAVKSAIYPGKGTPFGVMYCALGLGEAGEVQNKVKKAFRDDATIIFGEPDHQHEDGSVIYNEITDERKIQIMKEMGGVLWYLAALADELGVTLSQIALMNLEELCGRGERNTLSGDGDDR